MKYFHYTKLELEIREGLIILLLFTGWKLKFLFSVSLFGVKHTFL